MHDNVQGEYIISDHDSTADTTNVAIWQPPKVGLLKCNINVTIFIVDLLIISFFTKSYINNIQNLKDNDVKSSFQFVESDSKFSSESVLS